MANSLTITQKDPQQKSVTITLEKEITENTDFSSLEPSLFQGVEKIIVDFEKVKYINSSGVRGWIFWLSLISKQFPQIHFTYIHCPKVVIDQINYIQHFLPATAHVESMYAPFYDKKKDSIQNVLLRRGSDFHEVTSKEKEFVKIPDLKNSEGHSLDIDISPEIYFRFLSIKR